MDYHGGTTGGSDTCYMEDSRLEPLAVTVDQAASLIGISRSQAYVLMDAGKLDFLKIGTARRVPMDGLKDFIERQRVRARIV